MKFYIWSDVHNDFGEMLFNPNDYEGSYPLIICGDWGTGLDVQEKILKEILNYFDDVVFVPGNHDFYGSSFKGTHEKYSKIASVYKNFHYLDSGTVELHGVNIIGAVLWTNMGNDSYTIRNATQVMNDFNLIQDFQWYESRTNNPVDVWLEKNEEHTRFILDNLSSDKPNLVVTHHAPHEICIQEQYKNSWTNNLYCTNDERITDLFNQNKINAWIHGHMHAQDTVYLNEIPIHRNARGYHKYENMSSVWEPNKIYELN